MTMGKVKMEHGGLSASTRFNVQHGVAPKIRITGKRRCYTFP